METLGTLFNALCGLLFGAVLLSITIVAVAVFCEARFGWFAQPATAQPGDDWGSVLLPSWGSLCWDEYLGNWHSSHLTARDCKSAIYCDERDAWEEYLLANGL